MTTFVKGRTIKTAEAVVTVLEREGVTVEVPPDQTC